MADTEFRAQDHGYVNYAKGGYYLPVYDEKGKRHTIKVHVTEMQKLNNAATYEAYYDEFSE